MGDEQKTPWSVFVSNRLAPALAASIGSYLMTRASLAGENFAVLGFDSEAVKSSLVFALTILFTDPMFYVRALAVGIISIRQFYGSAKHEVEDALNQPIETEKE